MSFPGGRPSAPHPGDAGGDLDSWMAAAAFNATALGANGTMEWDSSFDYGLTDFSSLNADATGHPNGLPQANSSFLEATGTQPPVSDYANIAFGTHNNFDLVRGPIASTSAAPVASGSTTEQAQEWQDWNEAYLALETATQSTRLQNQQGPVRNRTAKPRRVNLPLRAALGSSGQRTEPDLSMTGLEFAFKLGPLQKGVKTKTSHQMNWTGDDSNVLGSELKILVAYPGEVRQPFKVADIDQAESTVRQCEYRASLHVVFTSLPDPVFGAASSTWQQNHVAIFFVKEDHEDTSSHLRPAYCCHEPHGHAEPMAYPHNIEYGYSLHQAKGKQAWGQHTEKAPHRLKPLILRKRGSAFAQDEHICTLVVEIHDKDGKIVTYGDGHECRAESNKFQFMSRNHAATSKKRRLESIANLESDQQLAYNEIYKDEELERARPQPHSMTSHPFGEPAPRPAKPKPDPRPDVPPVVWTPLNRYSRQRHSHHWTDRIALISQYLAYKHAGRIKQNLYEPRLLTREDFPLLMEASVEHYQEMSFGDSDEVEPNSVLRSRGSMDFRSPREYYTYDFASVERRINAVLDLLESRQEPLPYLVDTCVNFTLHTVLFREETVPPSDAEQRPTVKLSVHTLGEEGAILRRVNPLYALAWLVVSSSTHSEHVSNWVIRPYQEAMIAEGIRFDDSDIERFRWILHLVHLDQLLHWLSDNRQSYLSAFASRVLEQEIELAQTREGANMPRSMNFEA